MRRLNSRGKALALLLLAVVSSGESLHADSIVPWRRLFPAEGTVEYVPGNLPIVVAAPHGGRLAPPGIPDRRSGVLVTDAETDRLAVEIAYALRRRTGRFPHLVICHLKRSKVDCNRDALSGAGANPRALATWRTFHECIALGRSATKAGLFLDLHGHSHPDPRVELGYRLSGEQLAATGEALAPLERLSTLAPLAKISGSPFEERLRGATSLGGFLEARGYPSLPSPTKLHPDGAPYFQGGYNVEHYRARRDDPEDRWISVQIECPRPGVRDSVAHRLRFAEALAESLELFLAQHAGIDLANAEFGPRGGSE